MNTSDSSDTVPHRSEPSLPIFHLGEIDNPIRTSNGEIIYELVGRFVEGTSERHSLAYIVMSPGTSSLNHFHPTDEETYYILKGKADMMLDGIISKVSKGHAIFIAPGTEHKIVNSGAENLEFLAVSAPAWNPEGSRFLERWENGHAVPIEVKETLPPKGK